MSVVGGEEAVACCPGDAQPDTSVAAFTPPACLRPALSPVIGTLISRSGHFTDLGRVGRKGQPGSDSACDAWLNAGLQAVGRVSQTVEQGVAYVKYSVVLACLQLGAWMREQEELLVPAWEGISAPPPGCDAPCVLAKLYGQKKVCPPQTQEVRSVWPRHYTREMHCRRPCPSATPPPLSHPPLFVNSPSRVPPDHVGACNWECSPACPTSARSGDYRIGSRWGCWLRDCATERQGGARAPAVEELQEAETARCPPEGTRQYESPLSTTLV